MATGPRYHVEFRRRRQGRTDFRLRKRLVASDRPRAVVRTSNRNVIVQLVEFHMDGDRVLVTATTRELAKFGWKHATGNTPGAYLAGYMAGKRALKRGMRGAVLDIGLRAPKKGSKVFAALKGMLDAGLDIPHDDSVLPSEDRIHGQHIGETIPGMVDSVLGKIKEES